MSKHFELRRTPQTRHVTQRRGAVVDVYVGATGDIKVIPRPAREISVTTSDGTHHNLWEFLVDVIDYWRQYLKAHGVRIRRQPLSALIDD